MPNHNPNDDLSASHTFGANVIAMSTLILFAYLSSVDDVGYDAAADLRRRQIPSWSQSEALGAPVRTSAPASKNEKRETENMNRRRKQKLMCSNSSKHGSSSAHRDLEVAKPTPGWNQWVGHQSHWKRSPHTHQRGVQQRIHQKHTRNLSLLIFWER